MWESTSNLAYANRRFIYVCREGHSALYFNTTSAEDCTCDARFKARPDIAGIGTIVSFATLSMFTIAVAAVPAYYDSIVRYRTLRRARIQHKKKRAVTTSDPASARPVRPTHQLTRLETARSNIMSRSLAETGSIENFKTFQASKPRLRTAEKVLGHLCDIQLFMGLSMLIAAFVQGEGLSFYHESIVINYYWFVVQSFWASRQNKWWEAADQSSSASLQTRRPLSQRVREFFIQGEPFRHYFRRFLIFACTTLFVALYGRSIHRQSISWDPRVSGKCYRSDDDSNGPSDWFWLTGIGVYDLVLFLSMFTSSKRGVAAFSNMLHTSEQSMFRRCAREWTALRAQPGHYLLKARRVVWLLILGLAAVFWCLFVQGATNWFFGDGIYALEVTFYVGMWCWAAYDIIDLKSSNKDLLLGSELTWTFGQILALALMGLVVFHIIDAWESSSSEQEDGGLAPGRRRTDSESADEEKA